MPPFLRVCSCRIYCPSCHAIVIDLFSPPELVPVAQPPKFVDAGSRNHELSEDRDQDVECVHGCYRPRRVGVQNRARRTMLFDHLMSGVAFPCRAGAAVDVMIQRSDIVGEADGVAPEPGRHHTHRQMLQQIEFCELSVALGDF